MDDNSNNNAIEIIITKAMMQLGFSPAFNGFYFLREAVKIAYFDEETISLVTKLIYLPLAKEFKTTSENIEKSIRKSAESVWKVNSNKTVAVLNNIYTFSEKRPENNQLIKLICTFVKHAVNVFDTDIGKGI